VSTLPLLLMLLFLLVFLIAIPAGIYVFAKLFPQRRSTSREQSGPQARGNGP
jgi:hypothetical protein